MRADCRVFILGLAIAAASGAFANAAPTITRLKPDEIQKSFFNGQSFTVSTLSDVKFTMTFTPDGKVTRQPVGKSGAKGEGTWALVSNGFCTTWKGAKSNCFVVLISGENKWSVMKGSGVMAVWSK